MHVALLLTLALAILIPTNPAQAQCTSCDDEEPPTLNTTINSADYFAGTNCDVIVTFRQYIDCDGPCELEILTIEVAAGSACSTLSDGQIIELAITAVLKEVPCAPVPPSVSVQTAVYMGACLAEYYVVRNGQTYRGLGRCGDLCCSAVYVVTFNNGIPSLADKVADVPASGAECPPINPYEAAFYGECQSACDYFPDDLIVDPD